MLGLLSCTLLLCLSVNAVELYVDTELVQTDVPPQLVGGRTLVPMRAIFEYLGAEVTWDNDTRTATGTLDDTVVIIQIDNTTAYVNDVPYTLDVPAQIIGNRTMVPARFVSESLGCVVTWYNETQTAAVANKTKGEHIYVTKTGKRYHYSGTCNGGTYYEAISLFQIVRKISCKSFTASPSMRMCISRHVPILGSPLM